MVTEQGGSGQFGKAYWEDRYDGRAAAHGGRPNPHLVTEAGDLTPGTALDAGCGEGADAVWLASRGWRVTAVDIAATALRRAREYAETLGAGVTGRIDWVQADLTGWTPAEDHFDLVCAHYVHTQDSDEALVHRLAASVAPGGTLLIVGHHPSGSHPPGSHPPGSHPPGSHGGSHTPVPEAHLTADEVAAGLDPDRWDVTVAEARSRSAPGHEGHEITLRDTVLRARRRP